MLSAVAERFGQGGGPRPRFPWDARKKQIAYLCMRLYIYASAAAELRAALLV